MRRRPLVVHRVPTAEELSIVGILPCLIQQAEFRRSDFVEEPLGKLGILADLMAAQVQHLAVGRLHNHFCLGLKRLQTQQPVVIWRSLRVSDTQPTIVGIESWDIVILSRDASSAGLGPLTRRLAVSSAIAQRRFPVDELSIIRFFSRWIQQTEFRCSDFVQ